MIAYHVWITTKVLEYGYDLGIKCQGQILLNSVIWLITGSLSFFYGEFIFSTMIAHGV